MQRKEFVESALEQLLARVSQAEASESPNAWIDLYRDWNDFAARCSGDGYRATYAYAQDTNNQAAEEALRYYRPEIGPAAEPGMAKLLDHFLGSRHRDAIGEQYGARLIVSAMAAVEPLAPVNSELRVREGDVVARYEKLTASAEVEVEGTRMTLPRASGLQSSSNAETRKAAWFASKRWYLENREVLAGCFDELVHLRDEMARNLGHVNYVRLGYLTMVRTDYGPKELEAFRDSVRKYAVPLLAWLDAEHAKALGTETLRPWDVRYQPHYTLPNGIAPIETQLDNAQAVFKALSPRLAAHFVRMREEGLIDLENRKGKQAGAFTVTFHDEGKPAILCNSTGDESDVTTLIHEMGHAFQSWESQKIEPVELRTASSDGAEIPSMGMEFLSLPHIEHFFRPENAKKFRRHQFYNAVNQICGIAATDEFEHWVYEHPNASAAERDKAWARISNLYMPGRDYTGYEDYSFAGWYAIWHSFRMPFYYIGYGIAQTAAMQLGMVDSEDHERALATYFRLCELGGTMGILNLFKTAGFRSPFDPATMRDLMNWAAKALELGEMAPGA